MLWIARYKWLIFTIGLLFVAFLLVPVVQFETPYSTIILDRHGTLLGATIADDGQWRFPPRQKIPDKYSLAVKQYEDRRFEIHPGIDPISIVRAIYNNIKTKKIISGASTITMQVVRLSRQNKKRTYLEKTIEAFMALRLELALEKDEILATYAAHAPFGGNVVGLEAATWRYFGRSMENLTWAEAATLAVLPNSPSLIHPGKNRQKLLTKRNRLLDSLASDGFIDPLTCDTSKLEPLPAKPHRLPRGAYHLMIRARSEAKKSRIETSLDARLQKSTINTILRHNKRLAQNEIHNIAALILEVDSGRVAAYVGNVPTFKNAQHANHVDVVTSPRSTGSLLKPLLYAALLKSGELLPNQLVADIPTRIRDFSPENFSRTFDGAVPASQALARSLNVPAVRLLRSYGVDRFYALLKEMGMTTLDRPASTYGLSLMLGGSEATLWDLTSIYAGLARAAKGSPRPFFPATYLRECKQTVLLPPSSSPLTPSSSPLTPSSSPRKRGSKSSRLVREWIPASASLRGNDDKYDHCSLPQRGSRAFDSGAAYLTLEALLEVRRPGVEKSWRSFASSRQIAWKTGTSYGFRDAWAIGVTPQYAIGVWVGNADGMGRPLLTGHASAAPILFELFSHLEPTGWFQIPYKDLTSVDICHYSGMRKGPHCPKIQQQLITPRGLNSQACIYCQRVHLDQSQTWQVHGNCERLANIKTIKRFVLPPHMEWYFHKRHADYRPLPTFRSDCNSSVVNKNISLACIYPKKGSAIFVPRELDGHKGRAIFEAAHRKDRTTIFWHLDNTYLGATTGIHHMPVAPEPGSHLLTLVDENGEQLERRFTVLE